MPVCPTVFVGVLARYLSEPLPLSFSTFIDSIPSSLRRGYFRCIRCLPGILQVELHSVGIAGSRGGKRGPPRSSVPPPSAFPWMPMRQAVPFVRTLSDAPSLQFLTVRHSETALPERLVFTPPQCGSLHVFFPSARLAARITKAFPWFAALSVLVPFKLPSLPLWPF